MYTSFLRTAKKLKRTGTCRRTCGWKSLD